MASVKLCGRALVGCFGLAFMLSACASETAPPLPASEIGKPPHPYMLGVGDKVRVTVYREPELSGEFEVGGAGTIAVPMVGEVPVKGLTRTQAQDAITQRLAHGILQDPSVSVDIYDFRTFAILGEVQRPGTYAAKEGTTLTDAIAMAGGYTYRANEKRVLLRRGKTGPFYQVRVEENVTVEPGDAIRIEEVHF